MLNYSHGMSEWHGDYLHITHFTAHHDADRMARHLHLLVVLDGDAARSNAWRRLRSRPARMLISQLFGWR
jgi:hypothetical protein